MQCDQIGQLLEFLGTNFITKVTQMMSDFLGHCENHCFLSQTGEANFGDLLEQLGQLFISTTGHTLRVGKAAKCNIEGPAEFNLLVPYLRW